MDTDYNNQPSAPQPSGAGQGMAVAALICGIFSVLFGIFGGLIIWWLPYVGMLFAVVGIVLAAVAKKQGCSDGIEIGGLAVSIIGFIISLFFGVSCTACHCVCKSTENSVISGSNNLDDALGQLGDAINNAINNG